MYLVYDNATNNVLAEYETFAEDEQRRIQVIGLDPMMATAVEVLDLDALTNAAVEKKDKRDHYF